MPRKNLILAIDDTGSRDLTDTPQINRNDKMDCFGLGGVLIPLDKLPRLLKIHKEFCSDWGIDYPLHSTNIRGMRGNFLWLKSSTRYNEFMSQLNDMLLDLPIAVTGAIINRPGYFNRYQAKYDGNPWHLDKTAFCIVTERAAKVADSQRRRLSIVFEGSGPREDQAIKQYALDLKASGCPFQPERGSRYQPLSGDDYSRIIDGTPSRQTKKSPLLQIADLVLYPIAKAGYDPTYRPYVALKEKGLLIDDQLTDEAMRETCGIKYSCFDDP